MYSNHNHIVDYKQRMAAIAANARIVFASPIKHMSLVARSEADLVKDLLNERTQWNKVV